MLCDEARGRRCVCRCSGSATANPLQDELRLDRQIFLDFDGRGYTIADRLTGKAAPPWRLEVGEGDRACGRVSVEAKTSW